MINIYEQKLTSLQRSILRFLSIKRGKKVNILQIAKNIGVSQQAISKALKKLVKTEIVLSEKDKETKRYSIELNINNPEAASFKKIDNLDLIYSLELDKELEKLFPLSTIILFGSYSQGEDTINSDIDIAIINAKEKDFDLSKFEKTLERKININFYESLNKINKTLKENILNGIVILGNIEL
jgi:predicted nucleotidyltransferase